MPSFLYTSMPIFVFLYVSGYDQHWLIVAFCLIMKFKWRRGWKTSSTFRIMQETETMVPWQVVLQNLLYKSKAQLTSKHFIMMEFQKSWRITSRTFYFNLVLLFSDSNLWSTNRNKNYIPLFFRIITAWSIWVFLIWVNARVWILD